MLQIADAAVDHLEGMGRGSAAEVASVDQHHPKAALHGIERACGTKYAGTDNGNVELASRHCLQAALGCVHAQWWAP